MKKLVIFDLDGTLLNTIADLAHSTNYALNKLGYPTHEIEKYNFMVGNGIDKLFERALPEEEKSKENVLRVRKEFVNPEKPDVPLNKNDAFQKVQKRRVQEKR